MQAHHVAEWQIFANGILQFHAALRRLSGLPPRDFAGIVIDDAEVDRIVSELPGLDGPRPDELESAIEHLRPKVARLTERLHAALGDDDPLFRIADNAGLSPEEVEVFAVIAAVELSPQLQRLVGYLQDSVNAPHVWLSTIDYLFGKPHAGLAALANSASLLCGELVAIDDDGPWSTRSVTLPPRVAWAIAGDASLDPGLPTRASIRRGQSLSEESTHLAVVTGADRESRLLQAMWTCGRDEYLVTPAPAAAEQWQAVIREATIGGRGVVLDFDGAISPDASYWTERATHLSWAICSQSEPSLDSLPDGRWREVRVEPRAATVDEWEHALGMSPVEQHQLNPEQLKLVGRAYPAVGNDLDAAVRRLASGKLDALAVRVRPRRTWDDLVLPRHQTRQLRELVARYRHRSKVYGEWGFTPTPSSGIVALFSGQSGTGKTLSAELIAADLGLDLYKIDLSSVVSKYIGETEKNLEGIFSAAASGNLVLFFDEADALFGKRSDVSDSHDRYANIEVAYLLQRLETYDGIVILATNLQGNIDQAFLRRIHVTVDFPLPDEVERRKMWANSFPNTCPVGELDLDFLAKNFKITGGNIRNAVLTAAFSAADAGTEVTMESVMLGLAREFEKLGRLRTKEEFGPYYHLLTEPGDASPTGRSTGNLPSR